MQQVDRARDRNRCAQQQVPSAIFNDPGGHGIGLAVGRGLQPETLAIEVEALRLGGLGQQKILGEIGRCGDTKQSSHALGPRKRQQQHDPAAHTGADHDQRPSRDPVDYRERILGPAADRAVLEATIRAAVAGIVEAHIGPALGATPALERQRLGAGHVGSVAAAEQHRGLAALQAVIGQPAIRHDLQKAWLGQGGNPVLLAGVPC
jgi:hypothetical protein